MKLLDNKDADLILRHGENSEVRFLDQPEVGQTLMASCCPGSWPWLGIAATATEGDLHGALQLLEEGWVVERSSEKWDALARVFLAERGGSRRSGPGGVARSIDHGTVFQSKSPNVQDDRA